MGIKMYDLISGSKLLKASYYLRKERALEQFPMLKREQLKGALVYYDGQQDDSRMNIALGSYLHLLAHISPIALLLVGKLRAPGHLPQPRPVHLLFGGGGG